MAKPFLDDRLWKIIDPLLPPPKRRRKRYPGRKPIGHRQALSAILFIPFPMRVWACSKQKFLQHRLPCRVLRCV